MSETKDESQPQEPSQEQAQEQEQEQQQEQPKVKGSDGQWYAKPESFGNSAGDKIQSTLAPVGNYAGKGFETVSKPVGSLVDPLLGGVLRAGEVFGNEMGVGLGNKEGGPAKQQEAEAQKMKEPVGGKEQNADNPLGL